MPSLAKPRTAASVLALVLGLTACAGGAGSPPSAESAQKTAMLLKIADETDAGGDPATAASLYRRLHDAAPKDPVPLGRLAGSLLKMGEDRAAVDAYRAALALDPDNQDFHRGLALALLLVGDNEGALGEIRSALAKRGDDPRLYSLLGVAQDLTGHHDLAQQTYRHGLEMAPANLGLRNNYALSLALAGNYAGAVTELQGITGPKSAPRYRLNLALAYGLAGDDAKAAATAREVLDERSVEANLADYALLRSMTEAQRTAAIIGSELHGTALAAGGAHQPSASAAASSAAPVAQSIVPPPAPVAVASAPIPLIPMPPAASSARAAPPPGAAPAASPAVPAAAAPAAAIPAAPLSSTPPSSDAARAASPQSRANAKGETIAQQISAFLSAYVPAATASETPEPEAQVIEAFLASHMLASATAGDDPHPLAETASGQLPAAPAENPSVAALSGPQPFLAPASASDASDIPEVTVTASRLLDGVGAVPERYAVQLASFMSEATARKVADDYAAKGIAATVARSNRDGQEWFAVRAGEFDTVDEAQATLHKIQSMGCAEAIMVHYRVAASRA